MQCDLTVWELLRRRRLRDPEKCLCVCVWGCGIIINTGMEGLCAHSLYSAFACHLMIAIFIWFLLFGINTKLEHVWRQADDEGDTCLRTLAQSLKQPLAHYLEHAINWTPAEKRGRVQESSSDLRLRGLASAPEVQAAGAAGRRNGGAGSP
jgi:hypothetical protein